MSKIIFNSNDIEKLLSLNSDPLITIPDIAKALNVTPGTIRRHLIKHNVYNANKYDDFLINKFDIIDTEEKAYWIGFLHADSDVSISALALQLAEKDLSHLLKFKKFMGVDYKIGRHEKEIDEKLFISFRYTITSTNFVRSLAKHGLVPRKSLTLQFPNTIPGNLIHHYMRGLIDGDGCWNIDNNNCLIFDLVSSLNVCETVQNYLIKNCNLSKTKLQEHPTKNNENEKYYNLKYHGSQQVRRIANYLYQDAQVFLDRKKQLLDNFIATHKFYDDKNQKAISIK
jgi:hypothetical protein